MKNQAFMSEKKHAFPKKDIPETNISGLFNSFRLFFWCIIFCWSEVDFPEMQADADITRHK